MNNDLFIKDLEEENLGDDKHLIINGDSLKVMMNMKSETIDLIFADEPYNIGKDFGNNKDRWDSTEAYIDWNKSWIEQAMRILKPNGTIYIMTATQFMPYIDIYLSERYDVISRIVWTYDSSGVQSKKKYGSMYEPIIMAKKSKSAKYTFNHEEILVEAKTGAKRGLIDYRKNPPQPYNTKKVPGNVWDFSRVRFKMDEYENHPTQKPQALLERIIKASSNPGDIVFDPFGGSFTTSKVAKNLNRKSVSVDINEDYFKIGIRRLELAEEYKGEKLVKIKERKTKNKSKKSRLLEQTDTKQLESLTEEG
ncbi:adenine-specific DNA-methyltransferase [Enterococcus sp. AZ172]|uniref:adenine-specific DNA-methyltransferase n=1 Tax=unclassified Enterococcus TaxID=2608891 RepID=UPI003F298986